MNCLALSCLFLTILLYGVAKRMQARFPRPWLGPVVIVPPLLVTVMLVAHIPYASYIADSRWLVWMLGPTTVAFAVPIYEYRGVIRRHWFSLSVGVVVGMAMAFASAVMLARVFHLPPDMARALLARSISTPFALAMSRKLGASCDLVSLFVVLTGLTGMLLGEAMLVWLPLRSRLARGAALGAGALGFGTAAARRLGDEEGVVASVTMMLAGVLMVLVTPLLVLLPV